MFSIEHRQYFDLERQFTQAARDVNIPVRVKQECLTGCLEEMTRIVCDLLAKDSRANREIFECFIEFLTEGRFARGDLDNLGSGKIEGGAINFVRIRLELALSEKVHEMARIKSRYPSLS